MSDFFGAILGGLFVGWILSWFGFDHMVLSAIQPFAKVPLTEGMYYLGFVLLGLIEEIIRGMFCNRR